MYFVLNIIFVILLCLINIYNTRGGTENFTYINLPESQLSYYFRNFPAVAEQCKNEEQCEYSDYLKSEWNKEACWGYEANCSTRNQFSIPKCSNGDNRNGWAKDKKSLIETFYTQADFGYVKQQINEIMIICEPLFQHDSSLECSKYLRYCRGRNIMVNFTDLLSRTEPIRYKMDVLIQGQIGGYCTPHYDRLHKELSHLSPLQSWSPELRYFEHLSERPIDTNKCDIIIDKPTYFMKIDATVNMYHHFCDFLNLYASLHVNMSHPTTFSDDINVIIWETFDYDSPFMEVFKAFSKNPILDLKKFRGETVCFRNLVLPLLPRMIFGLYYNTPIINGCEGSGLFQSFSDFILHRLRIPMHQRKTSKIRITLLSRKTKYRQILNLDTLVYRLKQNETYDVRHVEFERTMPFTKQLEITRNSDVFIGIHGAGLTHLLFLPNWATIFELYHCEDPTCYRDLARLRGINYLTWEDIKKLNHLIKDPEDHLLDAAYAKFTNYTFSADEFVRLVNKASEHVWNHKDFQKHIETSLPVQNDQVYDDDGQDNLLHMEL